MRYFKLFNSCRVVKGYSQAVIYDLERVNNTRTIPVFMYDVLTKHEQKSIEEIKIYYGEKFDDIIEEYFEFLIEYEYIFICSKNELKSFPTINYKFSTYKKITNSIWDIKEYRQKEAKQIIEQLSNLRCEAIEIRFYQIISMNKIKNLLQLFENTSITSIELIIKHNQKTTLQEFKLLLLNHPRIRKISIYASPFNEQENNIYFYKQQVNPSKDCGEVSDSFFSINFDMYSESQSCNTCLNKKISIDVNGEIKNCPSMQKSYGNIRNTTLLEALNAKEFKDLWHIKKDDIQVCKDCEFRYMCTDCRVFIDNPNDIYSRPSKCNYNPYIAKWKGEEGYRTLEECGVISNEQGFSIDHEKIAQINKELWGE